MQKGSKSKGMNLADVAKLHGMTAQELMPQLRKGIRHEYEHTTSKQVARRTALDHLVEFPDYYDRLDKIEKMHLGGDMSKHLAPNGKPSNLNHEQWHLVRTPEFKAWFGDWENDPENASKVVDENGEPLVVYHGTRDGRFNIFDRKYFGIRTQNVNSIAFFFTPDLWYAKAYSESDNNKRIKEYIDIFGETPKAIEPRPFAEEKMCFLYIKNPKYVKSQTKDEILLAKEQNYDGIILKTSDGKFFEIGVFKSNQIKLADGSNTTFDGDNPDIRFAKGGEIENLIDQGEIELKVYPTTPKHANLYGLKSENPLYIQSIFISENQRLKGIGKKVLKYLNDFAIENGHDVMFGHITQKASFSKDDSRESNLDDVAMIKNWLQSNGYEICEGNNDFYKVVNNPDIRFEKGGLIAPNGKPSNLTQEQWKLVRTPEFKAWFGDWENDPKNASKVVDENGEPLVVFHGTLIEIPFTEFDFNKADIGFHFGTKEQAENRIKSKSNLPLKKSIINSFFLNIRNLFEMTDVGGWEYPQRYIDEMVSDNIIEEKVAKQRGFFRLYERGDNALIRDYIKSKYGNSVGFIYNNKYEGDGKSFIVLSSEQIKLADGSNTTFDGSNPDIRFKRGGRTIAQTPAPISERIYGSKKNVKGSAASKVNRITFTTQLTKSIKNKIDEHNEEYPENKVTLATAKAVVRRGMGAYSKSHRPTISGGMPNSRQAWGLARLNKFLMKKSGKPVKKAYIQDDDLL